MSPQSSLVAITLIVPSGHTSDVHTMTNPELAQPATTAFSKIRRLDVELPSPTSVDENPLDGVFQNRKRKISEEDVPSQKSFPNCSVNFLSAIFNDIAKAQASSSRSTNLNELDLNEITRPHQSSQVQNYCYQDILPTSRKKPRLSLTSSLSRCRKSFKNLTSVLPSSSVATVCTEATQLTDLSFYISPSTNDDEVERLNPSCNVEPDSPIPTNDHVIVADHYTEAASIIDQVLNVDLFFPNLPATVSEHSCSSTNLTQTSVHANEDFVTPTLTQAQQARPNIVVGKKRSVKDCYGWFVETDQDDLLRNRAEAIAHAFNKSQTSTEDLSFSAATSPKSLADNDELEWAKAADTIDDVLGDFF